MTGVEEGASAGDEGRRTHRCRSQRSARAGWKWSSEEANMATELQQMIDVVAKDKGIDPGHCHRGDRGRVPRGVAQGVQGRRGPADPLQLETGQVELYAVRSIVAEVTNPSREISLERSAGALRRRSRSRDGDRVPEGNREARPHRGADGQAGHRPARPRSGAREDSRRVRRAHRRSGQRHGQAVRERRHHRGDRPRRVPDSAQGAVARGELRHRRPRARRHQGRRTNAKGPQVILSRTDPALLIKLFEQEVPEIYDGTVMIRGAVREAGDRAKVAVFSRERDVDPVGACVGMRGTRVQAIIRELRGEKIDIVEWSEDPVTFVTKALSPGPRPARQHRRRRSARDGSGGRGPAAVAGDRQEGPERPAGGEADRLEDRHQERRRQEEGSRAAARGHRLRQRRRSGAAN